MATSIDFLKQQLPTADVQAALATIKHTEGTSATDGYYYLFGSSPNNTLRFTDTSTHPNNLQTHNGYSSTAAGAYQILYNTYKHLSEVYSITGFDPATQDLLCIAIFDEIDVLMSIVNGHFMDTTVQQKLGKQWASLPLSTYSQPTHTLADVSAYYESHGGTIS